MPIDASQQPIPTETFGYVQPGLSQSPGDNKWDDTKQILGTIDEKKADFL